MPVAKKNDQLLARLKVLKGPHKGAVYKLLADKITIGRSSDNDICLMNDEKCSRKQALLILNSTSYKIKDLSNRSSIKINNIVKVQSDLQDGDSIQFGSSVLEYQAPLNSVQQALSSVGSNSSLPSPAGPLPVVDTPPLNSGALATHAPSEDHLPLHPCEVVIPPEVDSFNNSKSQKKSFLPKVIIGFIVLAGLWLFMSDSHNKKSLSDNLATKQDIEKNIQTLAELRKKEEEKRDKNLKPHFKNAQANYIKGKRDFEKGFYSRAIEFFQVCKILYPQHPLCDTALQQAQITQQKLIQAWMIAGKDYRDKRRFSSCKATFRNVMIAINDENHPVHKEARINYDICAIQYEDRY